MEKLRIGKYNRAVKSLKREHYQNYLEWCSATMHVPLSRDDFNEACAQAHRNGYNGPVVAGPEPLRYEDYE